MLHRREEYAGLSGERNDCVVRAISIAGCLDYNAVHQELAAQGRKAGRSTKKHVWFKAMYKMFPSARYISGWNGYRVKQVTAILAPGHYVINTRGHLFAFCDGVIYDWQPGLMRIVKGVWRLDI